MATAQTLSRIPPGNDNAQSLGNSEQAEGRSSTPVYVPPNEFRMKLLKRILSVDGNIDKKALQRLQRHSSDRALQANILFENGDVGTLISFDTLPEGNLFKERPESEASTLDNGNSSLPSLQKTAVSNDTDKDNSQEKDRKKERPLKLPPIILPPVYTLQPRPLIVRDFSGPPYIPPEATDEEWEELQDCRYLRPALKKYKGEDRNKLVL